MNNEKITKTMTIKIMNEKQPYNIVFYLFVDKNNKGTNRIEIVPKFILNKKTNEYKEINPLNMCLISRAFNKLKNNLDYSGYFNYDYTEKKFFSYFETTDTIEQILNKIN